MLCVPFSFCILHIGVSPSGKATDFDSVIRWFKSSHPSHIGAKYALLRFSFWKEVIRRSLAPPFPQKVTFASDNGLYTCRFHADWLSTNFLRLRLPAPIFLSLPPTSESDYSSFKIPGHSAGDFSYRCVHSSFPQKATLRLCCLLASALTMLRLATNFLRLAYCGAGDSFFLPPSEQAWHRLLRFFIKIRARSHICRSATNFAHSFLHENSRSATAIPL